jgi:hypothetical protein
VSVDVQEVGRIATYKVNFLPSSCKDAADLVPHCLKLLAIKQAIVCNADVKYASG